MHQHNNTTHVHNHTGVREKRDYIHCKNCGESLAYCSCSFPDEEKNYRIENLDCANCGLKIEERLMSLPAVTDATLTYPLKKLSIKAHNQDEMLPEIIDICQSIEPEVELIPEGMTTKKYSITGLDCANCAKKVERALEDTKGVSNAVISVETNTLTITANNPDSHLAQYQSAADSVEDGVKITKKEDKKEEKGEDFKGEIITILIGSLLFVLSWVLEGTLPHPVILTLEILSYLTLGGEVLLNSAKKILKGDFFDEDFLMSVATIAAFIIGEVHEGIGVMLFFRVGELIEDIAVTKSRSEIMKTVDMRPETVRIFVNGNEKIVPVEEVSVGDTIIVNPGEKIPLDGTVIKGNSQLDTSAITGESVPVLVSKDKEILSGSLNLDSRIEMRVDKKLSESTVTKVLDSVENAAANKPKIDRFITRFSRVYTPIVVFAAILIAVIPSIITGNYYYWVYTAITFLVISCPCALVLSVPLAYFCGIGAASKLGIFFKGGIVLEAIAKVKSVVLDKTGTLTKGNFVVQEILPNNTNKDDLLELAASAESASSHPIAQSILKAAEEKGLKIERVDSFDEHSGEGVRAKIDNSTVLVGKKSYLENNGIVVDSQSIPGVTEVYVAKDNKYLGQIVISDTVKENAKDAIEDLKKDHLKVYMLTGDSKENATAVAKKVGIKNVFAKLLPHQKLDELQNIRSQDGGVLYIGDGINDAPVLAGADVGGAMSSGADIAVETADIVFMNQNLEAIEDARKIGEKTSQIAWQNVVIALGIKAIIMLLGIFGFANMWFAVFADTGVALICILNSIRLLFYSKKLST